MNRLRSQGIVVFTGFSLCLCSLALATTRYVSPTGSNTSPYTSWSTAATSIQPAINVAVDGDTVLVTNGTYTLSAVIVLHKNITLKSVNGSRYTTINGNSSVRCIHMDKPRAIVDGFTITGGKTSYGGGGIYMINTGLVQNCVIAGNIATNSNGGGIYATAPGRIYNCTISNNVASTNGGGVFFQNGGTLYNCTNLNNSAAYGAGAWCSGIMNIANCTFRTNVAQQSGGAISLYGASGMITNCVLSNNLALAYGGSGLYLEESSPTLSVCRLIYNRGYGNGGGIRCVSNSKPKITSCTFSLNRAVSSCPELGMCYDSYGGGISIESKSDAIISNCTISNNYSSYYGGGIACIDSSPNIVSCTIQNNSINYGKGGGISCADGSEPLIQQCTIKANDAFGSYDWMEGGGIYSDHSGPIIESCDISQNYSAVGGGIAFEYESYPLIENCKITNNFVTEHFGDGYGGGIYGGSDGQILNCEISGNYADYGGGGMVFWGADSENLIVSHCFIRNNSTYGDGGGIFVQDASPYIDNSVIVSNYAEGYGGGVDFYEWHNLEFAPEIRNCTISSNATDTYGAQLAAYKVSGMTGKIPVIENTIIWGVCRSEANQGSTAGAVDAESKDTLDALILDYCDVQDGNSVSLYQDVSYGSHNIASNPDFVDEAWRIESGTPCIDRGNSALVKTGETDIDDQPRILGPAVEIGADEVE